jgi:hypothetical protein
VTDSALEALASARKLCRLLGSAPDPQRQGQSIAAVLLRAEGWSPAAEARITAFSEWVAGRPPPTALKPRLQALIKALEQ